MEVGTLVSPLRGGGQAGTEFAVSSAKQKCRALVKRQGDSAVTAAFRVESFLLPSVISPTFWWYFKFSI